MTAPLIAQHKQNHVAARCEFRAADVNLTPAQALSLFHRADAPAILESSMQHPIYGRWSLFMSEPVDVCRAPDDATDVAFLREALARRPVAARPDGAPPFAGGWVGYLSYEMGARLETVVGSSRRDLGYPLAEFRLYDTVALFDHASSAWSIGAIEWPAGEFGDRPDAATRINQLEKRLQAASAGLADANESAPDRCGSPTIAGCSLPIGEYMEAVKRARDYIAAGDIFQMNLTNRYEAFSDASPWDVYRRLRTTSPSFYGCLLDWPEAAIVSSSPELFLRVKGSTITTRPIKGTARRSGDDSIDQQRAAALASSLKETAELNMIVDLLRNDLGRIAQIGSVNVVHAGEIEFHPTVIHRVATLTASLPDEKNWLDALTAAFPGGSITGCPKIRAMQLIDQLEPVPRGVYCGAIGWIGLDGDVEFNIAIRTMVLKDGRISFHAGGAILAESEPMNEWEEIRSKARAMMAAAGEPDCKSWECARLPMS